jgi:hypothetical protein
MEIKYYYLIFTLKVEIYCKLKNLVPMKTLKIFTCKQTQMQEDIENRFISKHLVDKKIKTIHSI